MSWRHKINFRIPTLRMNVSLLASPQFYSRTLYVVGCISIPIHIFAGYCILFQTPVSMKSVKWNLLNLYFWSTFMDIFLNIITQPFLTPPSISGFLMGLIHYTGLDTGIVLYFGITMMACQWCFNLSDFIWKFQSWAFR